MQGYEQVPLEPVGHLPSVLQLNEAIVPAGQGDPEAFRLQPPLQEHGQVQRQGLFAQPGGQVFRTGILSPVAGIDNYMADGGRRPVQLGRENGPDLVCQVGFAQVKTAPRFHDRITQVDPEPVEQHLALVDLEVHPRPVRFQPDLLALLEPAAAHAQLACDFRQANVGGAVYFKCIPGNRDEKTQDAL